jgi:hypothetical protein
MIESMMSSLSVMDGFAPVLGNRTSTINILRRGQTEIGPRRLGREGGDLQ